MLVRFLILALTLVWASASGAQVGYTIQPGDELNVEVLEDPSLNRRVLVLPDGSISFPLVGSLQASGRTTDQVRSALANQLQPNFASTPSVFVSVARVTAAIEGVVGPTIDVYVMGEVGTPGLTTVESGTTLLQFLAQTGGFSRFAAKKRIQLRRVDSSGAERVYNFNYRAVENGSSRAGATVLADGDVIVVPQRRLFE